MLKLIPNPLITGLMQAEPATALSLIRVGALQNATAAEPGALQTYLAVVKWKKLMQAEPAIATSLIRAGVLQNAIAAGPGAKHTYSATANWKSPSPGRF
ncbi:hypothetical protein P8452_12204 [Trifolium repens]|nr:hypothetical protein P8452_12204 [Trifolium repens]